MKFGSKVFFIIVILILWVIMFLTIFKKYILTTKTKLLYMGIFPIIISCLLYIMLTMFVKSTYDIKTNTYDELYSTLKKYNKQHNNIINRINLPVYYINLDKDINRNLFMVKQFKKYGVKATRISAVYGKNFNSIQYGDVYGVKFTNIYDLTFPELGCTLSHLVAIKTSFDNNDEIAVILEDDVSIELMPFWYSDLPDILKNVNADIIQLSNSSCNINNTKIISPYTLNCYGTFAYAIKRNGMKNILDKVYTNGTYNIANYNIDIKNIKNTENNSVYNKYDGRADRFLFKFFGISEMINIPLFFTTNVKTTIHTSDINDELAITKSIESLKYYIKHAIPLVSLASNMFIPINNKPVIWQIWTDTEEIPSYLIECHKTVKRFNDYFFSVILVTPSNIHTYINNLHTSYQYLSNKHKSDYLLCILLNEYGGMYLNLNTICFSNLEKQFKYIKNNDMCGYTGDKIFNIDVMGPFRPQSLYTTNWKKQLFIILDKKMKNLKTDYLGESAILQDIVFPLFKQLQNNIQYYINTKHIRQVLSTDILRNIPLPKINSDIFTINSDIHNNINRLTRNEIINNKNTLMYKLINKSNTTDIPTYYEILPGIHQILYINLGHRTDRKERIINEFNKVGVDKKYLHRIPAYYTPENGAIGCLHSHINALFVAMEKYKNQNVLICEDDIVFPTKKENLVNDLNTFFNDPIFKTKFDVVMLAHNTYKSTKTHNINIIKLLNSQTSAAYIVNKSYIKKLYNLFDMVIKQFNKTNIWLSEYCNDQSWKIFQSNHNWYGFKQHHVVQGTSYSDIEKKTVSYETFTLNTPNNIDKNIPICKWNLPQEQLQVKNLEKKSERMWGRLMLLNVVKQSELDYRLAYGTMLGSLRHGGFIDNDGDSDVYIIGEKNTQKFRKTIATTLFTISRTLYPNYIIDIHIGCYNKKTPGNDAGNILGIDKIDWGVSGYLCTITIWENERGKSLNYPHVLDIDFMSIKDSVKFGPKCDGIIYNQKFSSFEGGNMYCLKQYGGSYMEVVTNTSDDPTKRVYKGGSGDINQKNNYKKLQSQCKYKTYSEDFENSIKNTFKP